MSWSDVGEGSDSLIRRLPQALILVTFGQPEQASEILSILDSRGQRDRTSDLPAALEWYDGFAAYFHGHRQTPYRIDLAPVEVVETPPIELDLDR